MTTSVPGYKTLTRELIVEVTEFAQSVIEQFAQDVVSTEESPRGGGALAFLIPGEYQYGKVLGDVTDKKGLEHSGHAVNKNNIMEKHGVIISELVADPEADPPICGGGIQLSDGSYLSFSGFPPEWGQSFCIMLAERFDLVTPQRVNSIIEQSSDPLKARVYLGTARFFLLHYMFGAALGEAAG